MFQSILQDIKDQYNYGNSVAKVCMALTGVFIMIYLVKLIMIIVTGNLNPPAFKSMVHYLSMHSDIWVLMKQPWAIITHMFLHEGFFHFLWNALLLFWFGRITGELLGDRRILPIFLICGLGGAALFFLGANIQDTWNFTGYALGASGAVTGIIFVGAFTAPEYGINLMFIGRVALKYVAAFMILMNFWSILGHDNPGGAVAHLGGGLTGYIYLQAMASGNDWSIPVNKVLDKIGDFFWGLKEKFEPKKSAKIKKMKVRPSSRTDISVNNFDEVDQEKIDNILTKIKQVGGYDNLSKEEKAYLFKARKK